MRSASRHNVEKLPVKTAAITPRKSDLFCAAWLGAFAWCFVANVLFRGVLWVGEMSLGFWFAGEAHTPLPVLGQVRLVLSTWAGWMWVVAHAVSVASICTMLPATRKSALIGWSIATTLFALSNGIVVTRFDFSYAGVGWAALIYYAKMPIIGALYWFPGRWIATKSMEFAERVL